MAAEGGLDPRQALSEGAPPGLGQGTGLLQGLAVQRGESGLLPGAEGAVGQLEAGSTVPQAKVLHPFAPPAENRHPRRGEGSPGTAPLVQQPGHPLGKDVLQGAGRLRQMAVQPPGGLPDQPGRVADGVHDGGGVQAGGPVQDVEKAAAAPHSVLVPAGAGAGEGGNLPEGRGKQNHRGPPFCDARVSYHMGGGLALSRFSHRMAGPRSEKTLKDFWAVHCPFPGV